MDSKNIGSGAGRYLALSPSTSLTREIEGIHSMIHRLSTLNSQISSRRSDNDKSSVGKEIHTPPDASISTPLRGFNTGDAFTSSTLTSQGNKDFKNISSNKSNFGTTTPVASKRSRTPKDFLSNNSSLRFNATSLISLPYGYDNNTFTKIRCEDIIIPKFTKKKNVENFKQGKRQRKTIMEKIHSQTNSLDVEASSNCHMITRNRSTSNDSFQFKDKSSYQLFLHDDYASNPYKRRYYSVVNERKRLLGDDLSSWDNLVIYQDSQTLKRKFAIRKQKLVSSKKETPISTPTDSIVTDRESVNDLVYKQEKNLPIKQMITQLPQLPSDKMDYIKELSITHESLEKRLIYEMIEVVRFSITFRKCLMNIFKENNFKREIPHELSKELDTISLSISKLISSLDNDIVSLYYAKGLLNSDNNTVTPNTDSISDGIVDNFDSKKQKRYQKNEQYGILQPSTSRDGYLDNSPSSNIEKGFLATTPCITFINGLKCMSGKCATTKDSLDTNIATECDSAAGCYIWSKFLSNTKNEFDCYQSVKNGGWTFDSELVYDIMQQNKRHQLDAMIDFISDLSKVAVAEIRIPKPDWNEYSEYNCLNGYCCNKCCTCKSTINLSQLPQIKHYYPPFDDPDLNFGMETTIARMELHKTLLGTCYCLCKCGSENIPLSERIVSEHSPFSGTVNESISWYDIDVNEPEERENVIQERLIIRVRMDSIPNSWKIRLPFTCKLDMKTENLSTLNESSNTDLTPSKRSKLHDSTTNTDSGSSCDSNMEVECAPKLNEPENVRTHSEETFSDTRNVSVKDFKYLSDFTFWDALDILKKEQNSLHRSLSKIGNNSHFVGIFDPMEIDLSEMKTETLIIDSDSLVVDAKHDNFVEIAFYLPYVPSSILPWEFESADVIDILSHSKSSKNYPDQVISSKNIHDLLNGYNVVPSSFKRVFDFLKQWILDRNILLHKEHMLYKNYKRRWHSYLKKLNHRNTVDIFSWGVLPVRAMDLPNKFIPLPAGYKQNDINYPYIKHGTISPHECVGLGMADLIYREESFSQLGMLSKQGHSFDGGSAPGNRSRQRDSISLTRRKTVETETISIKNNDVDQVSRSNNWLIPNYSNLTGPSIRWTFSCMDTLDEPLHCMRDFKSLPIYKILKLPDSNLYKIDNFICYDRRNVIDHNSVIQEDIMGRVSGIWTRNECKIFIEKYLMYPKNFSKISQYLDSKKCSDCVDFYYRFKYRLKLKQRLKELKSRMKGKADATRFLKRETFVLNSLDGILDDCYTDYAKEFNNRNKISFNTISDYLLRSGALDSSQSYEIQLTEHQDNYISSDDEFQHTLDNTSEGYFFPRKYKSLVTRKNVEFPVTVSPDDSSTTVQRGCFILDYGDSDDEETKKSMIVALNTEAFFHTRIKGGKRSFSIIEKMLQKREYERLDDQTPDGTSSLINNASEECYTPSVQFQDEVMYEYDDDTNEYDPMEDISEPATPVNVKRTSIAGKYSKPIDFLSSEDILEMYDDIIETPSNNSNKKKPTKWTLEEKITYNLALERYGKDWNQLFLALEPYGKTMEQIKNFYHKNKRKSDHDFQTEPMEF
ncbi:Myb-like DNA-binding domain-containing protein [Theileria equi strain WA]|uniref:Myb-like DNA-binding domain-containing protein n=1 Tax=Theileria equi strain WA TaxID=1537102 RepID=L0B2T9_THEEQ|nr:Myb-like DNA-binding domain-containing protein [Theileria equi strain WA]AFZ81409.1 Myb-like DNA-binding domain-containing protein [Theileria equi strain WA]|eukprot:XP_004831075.1 Myb-like DNA-binding domain-containing protein [Theileria equi strain WA]